MIKRAILMKYIFYTIFFDNNDLKQVVFKGIIMLNHLLLIYIGRCHQENKNIRTSFFTTFL